MTILVDIGGTYARFALDKSGGPQKIRKIAAADFDRFEDAAKAYASAQGIKKSPLLISTAAHPDGKIWRFVNENKWVIDPARLQKSGFPARMILNDFEAATWGLRGLRAKTALKAPVHKNNSRSYCLIGPGTGLGLGYLRAQGKNYCVQKTIRGHIAAASVTAEQSKIIACVERLKKRPGMVVYEDLISGMGLINIYAALGGEARSPEDVARAARTARGAKALRLFHEFFGVFAASVTVSGDSFGGLYLMGGVIDRLAERNLYDVQTFLKFFVADAVPSVRAALDSTPVYRVTDPYIALKGLNRAAHG